MNIHRTSKEGCEEMINHFSHVCPQHTFSIQILEKLNGNGYLPNGEIDEEMRTYRLEREDFWIKTLRTIFPYGLNDKAKQKTDTVIIGKLFHKLPRHGDRPKRNRPESREVFMDKSDFLVSLMKKLGRIYLNVPIGLGLR